MNCAAPAETRRIVLDSQNTGSLSIEIPEHRVLENRNTAQFESVGEGKTVFQLRSLVTAAPEKFCRIPEPKVLGPVTDDQV